MLRLIETMGIGLGNTGYTDKQRPSLVAHTGRPSGRRIEKKHIKRRETHVEENSPTSRRRWSTGTHRQIQGRCSLILVHRPSDNIRRPCRRSLPTSNQSPYGQPEHIYRHHHHRHHHHCSPPQHHRRINHASLGADQGCFCRREKTYNPPPPITASSPPGLQLI